MATPDQIAELRRMVSGTDLTDEQLGTRIDEAGGDLATVAASIWREKAATYSSLVDMKEGSSSRNMSDLYKAALEMAKFYGDGGAGSGDVRPTNLARTRPAVREGGF